MDFDYEFAKNLALVVIPILIGSATSTYIVNSWQVKQEKFKLQKQILDNFQKTIPLFHHFTRSFLFTIEQAYGKYTADSKLNKKGGISGTIIEFPTEKSKQPFERFKEKHDEYTLNTLKINSAILEFDATIRLYFKEFETLESSFYQIRDKALNNYILVEQVYGSTNQAEFDKYRMEFWDEEKDIHTTISNFQLLLLSMKLKDIKL